MTRVLVVEDDAALRGVLRMVLEREGYTVEDAADGAAALGVMEQHPPGVAVVDFKMPVMGGVELIHRMRADARTAGVPVLLLSGFGEDAAGADLADAVIAKPFEPRRLLECLRSLVGG